MTDQPEPVINIAHLGGHCPVQAEGTIDGVPFYFRARGQSWQLEVGYDSQTQPLWEYYEPWGQGPHAAGWMDRTEAERLIRKAAALWRAGVPYSPEAG